MMCDVFLKIFQQSKIKKNLEEYMKQEWEMLRVVEAEYRAHGSLCMYAIILQI